MDLLSWLFLLSGSKHLLQCLIHICQDTLLAQDRHQIIQAGSFGLTRAGKPHGMNQLTDLDPQFGSHRLEGGRMASAENVSKALKAF